MNREDSFEQQYQRWLQQRRQVDEVDYSHLFLEDQAASADSADHTSDTNVPADVEIEAVIATPRSCIPIPIQGIAVALAAMLALMQISQVLAVSVAF